MFSLKGEFIVTTVRYIDLNPVKAGIVKRAENYLWSSARAHLQGEDDILVKVEPLLKIITTWQELLASGLTEEEYKTLRRHERTGRPLGSDDFITRLEKQIFRELKMKKPGSKRNS